MTPESNEVKYQRVKDHLAECDMPEGWPAKSLIMTCPHQGFVQVLCNWCYTLLFEGTHQEIDCECKTTWLERADAEQYVR